MNGDIVAIASPTSAGNQHALAIVCHMFCPVRMPCLPFLPFAGFVSEMLLAEGINLTPRG